jgi:ADP-ribosylglycohydrolase
MALCLAISLIVSHDFNPYDQLVRYKWWYKNGYMSSTGQCFDIGSATKQSLHEFERRQHVFAQKFQLPLEDLDYLTDKNILSHFEVDCGKLDAAGNGGLMRLAPVPLFFWRYPKKAVEYSGFSNTITHGDRKAYDACRFYGALIVAAIHGESKAELLDRDFYQKHKDWFGNTTLHEDVKHIAEGSYKKKNGYEDGIRGKGYVIESLKAALWVFWSDENSFEKGVLAAVNLGDDTDTTAAIYGQLAGAYYGYTKLPEKWVKHVYARKFITCLSNWIVYEGERWFESKSSTSTTPNPISKL